MKFARDEAVRKLRVRAEALIAQSDDPQALLLKRDVRTLLHDLSVHQVELEMQHDELQEASRATERARDEYQNLYNNAPVGYLTLDPYGTILKHNHTFSSLIDTSLQSCIGSAFSLLVCSSDRDVFLGRYKAFFKYPQGKNIDVQLMRTQNSPLWVRLTGRKDTYRNDTPEYTECLLLTVADIQLEKQAELELLQAKESADAVSRAKERFLSVVAHEFHTPLGLLTVSIDILDRYRDRLSESDRHEQHEQIRNASRQMTHLVDSVLAFNRQENVELPVVLKEIDVLAVSNSIIAEVNAVWNNGHRLDVAIASDCGIFLTEERLFRQILSNLLSNAFRFTPSDGSVSVAIHRQKDLLILDVSDTGIGIPPADQERVFDEFFRSANVEGRSGLGLGLSIVQDAVRKVHGRLMLQSTVHAGSQFLVEIPATINFAGKEQ